MSSVKTMASWPKVIKSKEELPQFFTNYIHEEIMDTPNFPYMVFIPPAGFGLKKYNAMVIYLWEKSLCFVEKIKKQADILVFPFEKINFIEKGTVLLNSWLKIGGIIDDKPVHKKFEFNTVAIEYMNNIVEAIRSSYISSSLTLVEKSEKEKFDYLSKVNYKFMSYGKGSLRPGGKVIQMMVQTEIKEERLRVFGKSLFKTVAPMHLSILTEEEYILLQDTSDGFSRYGIVYTYIPLSRIENTLQEPIPENDTFRLCLDLRNKDQIRLLFQNRFRDEVKTFLDAMMMKKVMC
ncbi:MAG: hypothetical protein N2484_04185 [Clostridia bacterium]|nr:hypothetical protein [Clostridia bacterium]